MRDRIEAVGFILMAAAHADTHVEAPEVDRIEEILETLWGEALPDWLTRKLSDFDPGAFDMDAAVRPFLGETEDDKRRLLEMAVSVHDSDGELDYREDAFVKQLGEKLGLELARYADLLLEVLPATPGTEPVEAEAPKAKAKAKKPAAKSKAKAKTPAKKKPASRKSASRKKTSPRKKSKRAR